MSEGRRNLSTWATALLAGGLLTATGCSQQRDHVPTEDSAAMSEMQFLHHLTAVPRVTFDEACRGILLVADGEERFGDYAERYAELRRRGAVRDAWGLTQNSRLDHGTLAFMAAQIGDLPPTAGTILFGSWGLGDRRYAVKQAAAHDLLGYASPYDPVTGATFRRTLARIDARLTVTGVYATGNETINAPRDVQTDGHVPQDSEAAKDGAS